MQVVPLFLLRIVRENIFALNFIFTDFMQRGTVKEWIVLDEIPNLCYP
jgi:hypothetical protein